MIRSLKHGILLLCVLCVAAAFPGSGSGSKLPMNQNTDWRNIANGREIPTETYSDQPYIVKTDDGAWLCVVTTGAGLEGAPGQHVVALRSTDQGRTWEKPVAVEPANGPEASYAVPLKTPGGRIYCFYNHNSDNLRAVLADEPPFKGGKCSRVDSLGYFVFKYSDDNGHTWSDRRYPIPVREMAIDRENPYGGKVRFFWNVGKPFIFNGAAYVPLHKVGGFGEGFFTRSEGVLLKSANLLQERDPEKIAWETLPDGDAGLRTPPGGGPISEEQSFVPLSDGSFYCVYRTIDGYPACAYSRDGGHTWSQPQYAHYADGRPIKHPRAANFVWRLSNGKYLYWFHNHGGRFIPLLDHYGYEDRNPVWVSGGVEADTPAGKVIRWSQPEILLYADDPYLRMSYPDLVEEGEQIFVTETQKVNARVHPVDRSLLEGMWGQFENHTVATQGMALSLPKAGQAMPPSALLPTLPRFTTRDNQRADYGSKLLRAGFSLDVWLRLDSLAAGQVALDNRTSDGRGFSLETTARGTLALTLSDGRTVNSWECDPGVLQAGKLQHVVAVVDGGPCLITFIVDGKLCDGGDARQFGWGRFSPNLQGVNGTPALRIGSHLNGEVRRVRLYTRALRTSEAVGNFQAGPGAEE